MALTLAISVIDGALYSGKGQLSKKVILFKLAYWADDRKGFCGKYWNAPLGLAAGVGPNRVRTIIRELEALGMIETQYRSGKGNAVYFKLFPHVIEEAIYQASPYEDTALNPFHPVNLDPSPTRGQQALTPSPEEGSSEGLKEGYTPRKSTLDPSSIGGVIKEEELKGSAATNRDGTNEGPSARFWLDRLAKAQSPEWVSMWLRGKRVTEIDGEVVLLVQGAFGKGRVEKVLETLSGGEALRVMHIDDYLGGPEA